MRKIGSMKTELYSFHWWWFAKVPRDFYLSIPYFLRVRQDSHKQRYEKR